MKNIKVPSVIFVLALCLVLGACGTMADSMTYKISFWNGGEQISSVKVEEGTVPAAPEAECPDGMRFAGWEPSLTAAVGDAEYHAVFVPDVRHVPYLFVDDEGKMNPSAALTRADFGKALEALAEPALRKVLPEVGDTDEPVSPEEFVSCLGSLFPETYREVCSGLEEKDTVTRRQAAVAMNALLGRTGETVSVADDAKGIVDVSPEDEDYADLMEAVFEHEEGEKKWDQIKLATDHEPGWYLLEDGRSYLIDDNGYLLLDRATDFGLMMDGYGYYTSGNEELDEIVRELLAKAKQEKPDADRRGLLYEMFRYVRDNCFYLRRDFHQCGETGWDVEAAVTMLTKGRGNCYNYAAAFCHLARGLGYNATAIAGTVGENPAEAHGWVEIELDGEIFYCDPEIEMLHRSMNDYQYDMFMMDEAYAVKGFIYDHDGYAPELAALADQKERESVIVPGSES